MVSHTCSTRSLAHQCLSTKRLMFGLLLIDVDGLCKGMRMSAFQRGKFCGYSCILVVLGLLVGKYNGSTTTDTQGIRMKAYSSFISNYTTHT